MKKDLRLIGFDMVNITQFKWAVRCSINFTMTYHDRVGRNQSVVYSRNDSFLKISAEVYRTKGGQIVVRCIEGGEG